MQHALQARAPEPRRIVALRGDNVRIELAKKRNGSQT
jgi:hypothetical protein